MQKIQKFQFGRSSNTKDSWKQLGNSTYKADENGAFEDILFSDGTRLNSIAA